MPSAIPDWQRLGLTDGQLTPIGVAQHKAFGRFLRNKYITEPDGSFIPSHYDNRKVYVRSTDVDRTLMSVNALFSELYPGAVFPTHTVPAGQDILLQPGDRCPSYAVAQGFVVDDANDRAVDTFTQQLIDVFAFESGWIDDKSMGPAHIVDWAHDNIVCMRANNISVPPNLDANFARLQSFTRELFHEMFGERNGNDPRGPTGGELTRHLAETFQSDKIVPLSVYSAHDTTLIALYAALGLLGDNKQHPILLPPYASSAIIEVRKKADGSRYATMQYGEPVRVNGFPSDSPDGWSYATAPQELVCPSPKAQCPIDDLVKFIYKKAPEFGTDSYCCLRESSFERAGCDKYDSPFEALPTSCQLYRRFCPAVACDAGHVVSARTLTCSTTLSAHAGPWRGVAIAMIIALLFALIGAFVLWRRYSKLVAMPEYSAMDDPGTVQHP